MHTTMWEITMDHNILIALVSSLLTLILGPLIVDVISVGKKIRRSLSTIIEFLAHDDTVILDDNPELPRPHGAGGGLMCRDVELVTARLGLGRWKCEGRCDAMGAIDDLTDDKRASDRELEEVFSVFDRNEDGFICAAELWSVMRRLGLKEGARYDDCMRMIGAFDEDGDGKISFLEFRRMMENAL